MGDDFWFVLYHAYTTSRDFDEKGLKRFKKDAKLAGELGIGTMIVEDYFRDFHWGEYDRLWSEDNFQEMIRVAHDHGIRVIPYTCATELSHDSETFKRHGKEWGARNRWGQVYSGFNSIFLPSYYPKHFFNKVMCPFSGWKHHLVEQVRHLFDRFDIDGIYLDRIDYRVHCFNHSSRRKHFFRGLPSLVGKIKSVVKDRGTSNILIVNDSCMEPDDTLTKCIKQADHVLTELLPFDWNPRSFYNGLNLNFGFIPWKFRKFILPLTKKITELQFQSKSMISTGRIASIIDRLKKIKFPEEILLFSHRRDEEGFRIMTRISEKFGCRLCYYVGLKVLTQLKSWTRFKELTSHG